MALNAALKNLNIKWKEMTPISQICMMEDGWEGEANGGLKVFVFPQTIFCRDCCSGKMTGLYVVHPIGAHGHIELKTRHLTMLHAWFISEENVDT